MSCSLLRLRLRAVFPVLLAVAMAALAGAAENTKKPISRDRLFRAVEIGGLSNDEFIGILRDFGVEFQLNDEDRANLTKAGVEPVVMEAIVANYRDPLRERIAQLAEGEALTKDNIVGLLRAGAGAEIVEVMVEKRGVAFAMSPTDAKDIEAAGGTKALLGALFLKQPVTAPVVAAVVAKAEPPAATPEPAPPVAEQTAPAAPEPVLLASSTPASISLPVQQAPEPVAPPPAATPEPAAANAAPINQAAALLTTSAKPAKLISGKVTYTDAARRARVQGKVQVEIVIDEKGRVEKVKALSGNPLLVQAATLSLRDWVYEPATIDGKPVKVTTQVGVTFQ